MINHEDPYTYLFDDACGDDDDAVIDRYIESQREVFRASWATYTDEDYAYLEDNPLAYVEDVYISLHGIHLPNDANELTVHELLLREEAELYGEEW